MPTYDYVCQKCGHSFEAFHAMSAASLTECPKCKGKLQRLIGTGAAVIFKGSGFYATDYRGTTPCGKEKPCSPNAPCAHKD